MSRVFLTLTWLGGCAAPTVADDMPDGAEATPVLGPSAQPPVDGYVVVAITHQPGGDAAFAAAQFWEDDGTERPFVPGTDMLDTCVRGGGGGGASKGRPVASVGRLELWSGDESLTLSRQASLGQAFHGFLPNDFQEIRTWSVSSEGGTFPDFALDDIIRVPEDLHVEAPREGFVVRGPLEVTWEGGADDRPVVIRLEVSEQGTGESKVLICEVENDGHFVLDHDLMDSLPAAIATVHVQSLYREVVQLDDRPVRFEGIVATLRTGSTL